MNKITGHNVHDRVGNNGVPETCDIQGIDGQAVEEELE